MVENYCNDSKEDYTMASFVIHLAVSEMYLKKHPEEKFRKNYDYLEFLHGSVFPDTGKNKTFSHCGVTSESNVPIFVGAFGVSNSFNRGWFLHLLTDYLFYNKYVDRMSRKMYDDYNILNSIIIKKYNLYVPEEARLNIPSIEGKKLTYLSEELVDKLVDEASEREIDSLVEDIRKKPREWTKFRPLKYEHGRDHE